MTTRTGHPSDVWDKNLAFLWDPLCYRTPYFPTQDVQMRSEPHCRRHSTRLEIILRTTGLMRLIHRQNIITATKCLFSMSVAVKPSSLHASPMYKTSLFEVSVLFQDAQLIVLNKPPNMMSVPGKEVLTMMNVRPRSEQWRSAISSLLEQPAQISGAKRTHDDATVNDSDSTRAVLQKLLDKGENVPRKEDRFKRYLQRFLKITDESEQDRIFRAIQTRDDDLHRIGVDTIPAHLLSASDVASHLASEYIRCPTDYTPTIEPPTSIMLKAGVNSSVTVASNMDTVANTDSGTGTDARPWLPEAPQQAMQQQKVHHVHRLDMETSGVLMFAKDEHISACIDAQFRNREVDKVYVARILGVPAHSTFTVSCPIRPDLRIRPYQIVDAAAGKPSVTECQVIETDSAKGRLYASLFPEQLVCGQGVDSVDDGATVLESSLIELRPLTGRTHQLRVHMAHIGHPILGDTLYPIPAQYTALTALASAPDLTMGTPAESAEYSSSRSAECTEGTVDMLEPNSPVSTGGAESAAAIGAVPELTAASAPLTAAPRVDRAYPRLCLHALQLTFRHPASGRQVTLAALSTEAAPQPLPSTVPADHLATTASYLLRGTGADSKQ